MQKKVDILELVALYTVKHLTMDQIGKLYGMTRQGVWKHLKKAGITRQDGERMKRPCGYCGVIVNRPRSQSRDHTQVFCSAEHYYASLENPEYQQWRNGSRLARAIVSQHYPLLARDYVVHHKDGNQRNNNLANLVVYASQADHMAVHRGRHVEPLWDGAQP